MWGVIGAALAGIASSLYDNRKNRKSTEAVNQQQIEANRQMMERQAELDKDYAKWSASELPTLNRQGMEQAGFNPILAITNGTGVQGSVSGSASSLSVPQSDTSGVASSLSSAVDQYVRLKQVKAGLDLAESQKNLINSKSKESEAKTAQIIEQTKNPPTLFGALGKAGNRLMDWFSSPDAKSLGRDVKKFIRSRTAVKDAMRIYQFFNSDNNSYNTGSAKSLDGRTYFIGR